jgi:hypothetical protein
MRNTLAECRRCWCPRRRRDRGAGRCTPGARDGGQTAASAVLPPNGFLTASLAQAGGAGPRRLEQLTTTLLNRETMSGSRKQHS